MGYFSTVFINQSTYKTMLKAKNYSPANISAQTFWSSSTDPVFPACKTTYNAQLCRQWNLSLSHTRMRLAGDSFATSGYLASGWFMGIVGWNQFWRMCWVEYIHSNQRHIFYFEVKQLCLQFASQVLATGNTHLSLVFAIWAPDDF